MARPPCKHGNRDKHCEECMSERYEEQKERMKSKREQLMEFGCTQQHAMDKITEMQADIQKLLEIAKESLDGEIQEYKNYYFTGREPLERHVYGMKYLQDQMDFINQLAEKYSDE